MKDRNDVKWYKASCFITGCQKISFKINKPGKIGMEVGSYLDR